MATVWVTGARGFIGRHLAAHLASGGDRVGGIGHGHWPEHDAARCGVQHWLNSGIATASLEHLAGRTGTPDVVYHLAGGSSVGPSFDNPAEDYERTVHTTLRLLDWLRQRCPNARVVAVSSAAVYGAGHPGPIAETTVGVPFSPYGYHKSMMETLARSYAANFGLDVRIARVFSAYGPGLRKQLLWDLCTRLARDPAVLRLDGTGAETRDWIHVDDLVRVLTTIAGTARSLECAVVNVATGAGHTIREVSTALARAWGSDAVPEFSGRQRAGDPASLVADVTRLAALGFAPAVSLEAGLAGYVAWYREAVG
jgi:UDP-glucose 4-epimerase